MKYISLFSGIEAASVAWRPLGWEPVAFSEIDPFPKAVLKHHYTNVPDLGDITKIDWSPYVGSADVVVGGSPCQSFSVAGSRTGLAGVSGLMWEYVRAVRELRPRWLVWENVPGALSSSHGEDFRCLLESLDDLGYGLAWRVLDAQFFGVAQRRRRVFVVGHLGDMRAGEVLFEPEGLRWDTPSSREKRKAITRGAAGRVGTASWDCLTPLDGQSRRVYRADGVYPTLCASDGKAGADARAVMTNYGRDIAGTLTRRYDSSPCADRGQNIVLAAGFSAGQSQLAGSIGCEREVTPTLRAGGSGTNQVPTVLVKTDDPKRDRPTLAFAQNQRDEVRDLQDCAGALAAQPGIKQQTMFLGDGRVRRLTTRECERLQGFEDDWTDVPYRGKDHSPDSARYKALGNSMAVPVMQWIGKRIQAVNDSIQTEEES